MLNHISEGQRCPQNRVFYKTAFFSIYLIISNYNILIAFHFLLKIIKINSEYQQHDNLIDLQLVTFLLYFANCCLKLSIIISRQLCRTLQQPVSQCYLP